MTKVDADLADAIAPALVTDLPGPEAVAILADACTEVAS
jgi:hypothetical protein